MHFFLCVSPSVTDYLTLISTHVQLISVKCISTLWQDKPTQSIQAHCPTSSKPFLSLCTSFSLSGRLNASFCLIQKIKSPISEALTAGTTTLGALQTRNPPVAGSKRGISSSLSAVGELLMWWFWLWNGCLRRAVEGGSRGRCCCSACVCSHYQREVTSGHVVHLSPASVNRLLFLQIFQFKDSFWWKWYLVFLVSRHAW